MLPLGEASRISVQVHHRVAELAVVAMDVFYYLLGAAN